MWTFDEILSLIVSFGDFYFYGRGHVQYIHITQNSMYDSESDTTTSVDPNDTQYAKRIYKFVNAFQVKHDGYAEAYIDE